MTPKHSIGTVVKTSTGLFEIDCIVTKFDGFKYGSNETIFDESDILMAYTPVIVKQIVRRKSRKKTLMAPMPEQVISSLIPENEVMF